MYRPNPPRRLVPVSTSALLLLLMLAGLLWGVPHLRRVRASYFTAFVVTNTNDAGAGSLRQAILNANANPGPDDITFNINGTGVHTITPLSPLPVSTETINIDGYTQPGAVANSSGTGNNAVLLVELDGSAAGAGASGLELNGNTASVAGLIINRFGGNGILFNVVAEGGVRGCYIGTNAAGTVALGNNGHGVAIIDSGSVTVGGVTVDESNLINGNGGDGVHISVGAAGIAAESNVVQGNRIGVGSGGGALPNTGNGIYIFGNSNTVGGGTVGEGNFIANNGSDGIEIASGLSNGIRSNSIFSNTGLGIELRDAQPDGTITPNDQNDQDDGPNRLQNFPSIDSATSTVNGTVIMGTLDSLPTTSGFRIDFYSSPTCDQSGNGEGQTYLGFTNVNTDNNGHATINASLPAVTTIGHFVTATTTTEGQNTSEFSPCRVVAAPTFNWDGSDDSKWHNGANWDTDIVPTASDNVVIPAGAVPNEPTISTNDAAAASLTVHTGHTLTITDGGILTSGTTTVNAGAALNVPAAQTGRLASPLTLNGALTGGNSASVLRFDGATLTNNGTINVGVFRFGGTTQTLAGTGAVTSALTEVLTGANVTLAGNHTLGALTVDGGGRFSQGDSFNLTINGTLMINASGLFLNLGTGDLTLAGDVSNEGAVNLNGGGAACGDADAILLRSTDPAAQRAWSGAGTFSLTDVDVSSQAGTSPVAVRSGTNSGNNGANWTFTVCPAGSTLTVNTNDDGNDGACNAAHCSLREAILTANSTPGQAEIIAFSIGVGGAQTISPVSALPTITDPVTIDGTTQPGFSGVPLIELNGTSAGAGSPGLNITAGGSNVRGLVINRFSGHGIRLASAGGNTIRGNFIGTNAVGTDAQANAGSGIFIDAASNNNVGGTATGEGNIIAFNGGDGVSVNAGTGNRVLSNSIHTNGTTAQHLGIDLGADGLNANDAGDADAGANNLQNFPVINSAASNGVTTNVNGSLNSNASTAFRVEFFSNATCDVSGNGEGAQPLGSTNVLTDSNGDVSFNIVLPNVAIGQIITATATDPAGNTSEFSTCRAVVAATYTLSGQVRDAGSQPLVGVNVRLSGAANRDTTTDTAGVYTFNGLPLGGNFTITPSETGYRFTPPSRTVNNLQSDQTGLDFSGNFITHTITGRAVDGSGAGLSGVVVTLAGARSGLVITGPNGDYSFDGVPTGGSFVVTLEREGFNFNPPNFVITDINADVNFNPVGTAQPSPTPTPDPGDDFEVGPEPDPSKWVKGIVTNSSASAFDPLVGVFVQGGLLHIQPRDRVNGLSFSGLVSVRAINLNSTPLVGVEIVQAAQGDGAQTIFGLGADDEHYVRFVVQNASEPTPATQARAKVQADSGSTGQTLLFQLSLGPDKFTASVTYDPVQHRFWRFRYEAPARLVIFETSPDFVTWTERFRAQLPADQTTLLAELSAGTTRATSNPSEALFDNFLVAPSPRVQFETSSFIVRESDGTAHVNVVRTGTDESPLSVSFSTGNGTASAGSDYGPVSGTLIFEAGERLKSFDIPIFDDDLTEGSETINITLSNPTGGRLGTITQAVVNILDDESENPINDTNFFVRQHYLDFLGREPDAAGLQFWTDDIRSCNADLQCREVKRVNVSAAFFLSIEFQGTGFFVQRLYRLSFGRAPTFAEYLPDLTAVREGVIVGQPGALERLELNKRAFAEQFANRAAFKAKFDGQNDAQYVDGLAAAAGVTLTEEERTALIVGLLTRRETRGGVLLKMVEKDAFVRAEFNRAFVQMQYFGYLRRDPDTAGFNFWLNKLNSFNGDYIRAEMVKAFISSTEYRARFGQP